MFIFIILIRAWGFFGVRPRRLILPCAAGAGAKGDAVRKEAKGEHAPEDLQHPAGDHAGQWGRGKALVFDSFALQVNNTMVTV